MAREDLTSVLPTPELRAHARELLKHLDGESARFVLWDKESSYEIQLSEELYELLRGVLIDLAQNRAIQIAPIDTELTTVQAAEFLQVSRPHIIKLIEEGQLACRRVGTHRRIKLRDLIDHGSKVASDSRAAREELTKLGEEHGWGY